MDAHGQGMAVLVQTRMSSARLPGKVLRQVAGRPLLQYLLERLGRCARVRRVIVLTSVDGSDDAIAGFCEDGGVECFRGDLQNVAKRFADAVVTYDLKAFVRISGDSPVMDPALVDEAMERFAVGDCDVVTNVHPRSFPPGESVEVVSAAAFRKAFGRMTRAEHLEHVTKYFYDYDHEFRIVNLSTTVDYGGIRLAVDTASDLDAFAELVSEMDRQHWEYSLDEIVARYRQMAAGVPG